MKSFTDFGVWKQAHQLVLNVYKLTVGFPREEMYGLSSQVRRAAVSITSNIAEGYGRTSAKEKSQFLTFAMGSTREVQNQIMIARDLGYICGENSDAILKTTDDIVRILYASIKTLRLKSITP